MCSGSTSAGSARVGSIFLCWKQYLLMSSYSPYSLQGDRRWTSGEARPGTVYKISKLVDGGTDIHHKFFNSTLQ